MSLAIEVEHVAKRYTGAERPALDGVTFGVQPGRICALLGENGAGKTTLLRILTTLLLPSGGRARVMGEDVVEQAASVRGRFSMIGQSAAVDGRLTGRQNLEMFGRLHGLGRAGARERAAALLDRLRLTGAADRPVSGYSGGMRRRIDLAAGLLTSPPVLFVDEPTTGVDPQARRELWRDIRALADGGAAVLLTTQYLEEAEALADDVVILKDGVVAMAGTPAELKRVVGEPRMELREPTLEDVYLHLYDAKEAS